MTKSRAGKRKRIEEANQSVEVKFYREHPYLKAEGFVTWETEEKVCSNHLKEAWSPPPPPLLALTLSGPICGYLLTQLGLSPVWNIAHHELFALL